MPDVHEQIAELEAEIEALAHSAERCRKIIGAAKLATVAGGLAVLLAAAGLLALPPSALFLGIGAALGGIAVAGSNRSTLDQLTQAIEAHEARRAALIDGIGLRVIEGGLTSTGHQ